MYKIDFKILVESLLFETLKDDMIKGMPRNASPNPIVDATNDALNFLKSSGQNYIKVDTILGKKPLWPLIDTIAFILKTLLDNKLIKTLDSGTIQSFIDDITNSNTVADFLKAKNTITDAALIAVFNNDPNKIDSFSKLLQDRVTSLQNNYANYRDYFLPRLKQMGDKTQIIAAEQYLPLTPYDGLTKVLKEYGGYDVRLVENILKYPAETRYTQKSNIEGPVMSSVVDISKLQLVFYREYITNTDPTIQQYIMSKTNTADEKALVNATVSSAGKVSGANKIIQQDYINFLQGKSQLIVEQSPAGVVGGYVPLVTKIGDFQGLTDTGQDVFQAYLHLFNNIKRGTLPSKWQIAGNVLGGLFNAIGNVGSGLKGF